jgi:hypothetical protein
LFKNAHLSLLQQGRHIFSKADLNKKTGLAPVTTFFSLVEGIIATAIQMGYCRLSLQQDALG